MSAREGWWTRRVAGLLREVAARLGIGRADREHQEEVAFHLEMSAAEWERRGVAPHEARRRAHVAFGGLADAREATREARGGAWISDLRRDARIALRQLQHAPGHAAAVVLTLALGIGANTALFSVLDGVLLRPEPFADPERLVVVWETDRASGTTREPASWPDYLDFASQARTVDGMAALIGQETSFAPAQGEPLRVTTVGVTHTWFPLIGIAPLRGRTFTAEEDVPGGAQVAMVGETFWRTRLDADPAVVGRILRIDDVPRQVVGIVPAGGDFAIDQLNARAAYHAPYTGVGEVAFWVPLQASADAFPRSSHPFFVVGRLAPGATVATASEEFTAIATRLEAQYPSNTSRGAFVESLRDVVFAPVRPVLSLLLGAVGLVLLVACVNVANLLLARGVSRTREVAVRTALGASSGRLGRQFMVESLVLALAGGVAGVALAWGALRALVVLAPSQLPRAAQVGIDLRVLGVTALLSVLVGLAFGLLPVLQARGVDVQRALKGEGRAASHGVRLRRFRSALVVTELAFSVTLVLCAGLVLRSLASVLQVNPGFDARGVLKAEFTLPEARYPRDYRRFPDWPATHRFTNELVQRVRAIPGVESVALSSAHPLDAGFTNSFVVVGREAEARGWPEIAVRLVSPGYFATMGSRLVRGRLLAEGDDGSAPMVAVLNEAAVERYFGDREPLGAEVAFWGVRRRVVGVVGDERLRGLTEPAPPALYAPMAQAPSASAALLVRTSRDLAALAPEVRAAVWSLDPQLAVHGVEPLAETLLATQETRRFAMAVLGAFAALTLLLALVGVHSVLSYATTQRTREIGIRLALGATRRETAGLVVREGARLALVGTALGLAGAALASRLVAGLLWGVGRADPLTHVVVALVAIAAAVVATAVPARRAARIQPTEALREG